MHINMFPRTTPAGAWKSYIINIQSFTSSCSATSLSYHSMIERYISMEGAKHIYQRTDSKKNFGSCNPRHVQWVIMEAENDTTGDSESIESIGEDSGNNSAASASSSDLAEEASSSSSPSYGPLYELSELMNQLPIKRGLSKHYQGKSQSFTSLANVNSLEDLAKKVSPYSQRMKSCKSYAGLDGHKFGPKAVIAKKSSRGSSFLSSLGSRSNFLGSCRHPISLQKNC